MRQVPVVWFERLVIVVGLCSFWPYILGHRGDVYRVGLVIVALLLGLVAMLRLRRLNRQIGDTSHSLRRK